MSTPLLLSKERVPALDGIRGLAILAVVFYHLSDFLPANNDAAVRVLRHVLRAGWCGVDLFFVLSGFLITGVLLDSKNAANYFRSFYGRRALRIFPLYYATLVAIFGFANVVPELNKQLPLAADRIFYFVYLNNWWALLKDTWHSSVVGHFWSLAVEEQFYLVWPWCIWVIPTTRIIPVAITGMAGALAVRVALYAHFGPIRDVVENPFARMDSLLMGALVACLVRSPKSLDQWRHVLVSAVSLITTVLLLAPNLSNSAIFKLAGSQLIVFSSLAVVFGGFLLHAFLSRGRRSYLQTILCNRALMAFGKYSYGIYVYHVPLIWGCARLTAKVLNPAQSLLTFGVFAVGVAGLTFLVAKISFECFELRFLRLKERFEPIAQPQLAIAGLPLD